MTGEKAPPISDKELWACANELVRQHGRGAVIHANDRLVDLQEQDDIAGAITWHRILERVIQLLQEEPDGPTCDRYRDEIEPDDDVGPEDIPYSQWLT